MFNRVCFFDVQDTGIDLDDLTLELIDFGAEEVERGEANKSSYLPHSSRRDCNEAEADGYELWKAAWSVCHDESFGCSANRGA